VTKNCLCVSINNELESAARVQTAAQKLFVDEHRKIIYTLSDSELT